MKSLPARAVATTLTFAALGFSATSYAETPSRAAPATASPPASGGASTGASGARATSPTTGAASGTTTAPRQTTGGSASGATGGGAGATGSMSTGATGSGTTGSGTTGSGMTGATTPGTTTGTAMGASASGSMGTTSPGMTTASPAGGAASATTTAAGTGAPSTMMGGTTDVDTRPVSSSSQYTTGPTGEERVEGYRTLHPHRPMLITGASLLVGSYATSAAIGATNDRDADRRLLIPVVGPWLDLADRQCGQVPCENEDLSKALLITSGVLQGAGALLTITSFFVPEKVERVRLSVGPTKVAVAPGRVGMGGYGLAAVGTF